MNACPWIGPMLFPKDRKKIIDKAVKKLRKVKFDTIAVSGFSGAILGSIVAHRLRKKLTLIRKPDDDSHSTTKIEGNTWDCKYIILDDLISSGKTYHRIRDAMCESELVGIYLYQHHIYTVEGLERFERVYNVKALWTSVEEISSTQ